MRWSFTILLLSLVVLASCWQKPLCTTDADCVKPHFTGQCVNKNCSFTPIPNDCGNGVREQGENECTCPTDTGGTCTGRIGKYFVKTCDAQQTCTTDLDGSLQKQELHTATDLLSGGDTFAIITSYKNPFNIRRDTLDATIYLSKKNPSNKDHKVTTVELVGETLTGQKVVLASKTLSLSKPIIAQGKDAAVKEQLRLDAPPGTDGTIKNLEMVVSYDYDSVVGSSQTRRSGSVKNVLRNVVITYVVPTAAYACPASCDDNNPGTEDLCDESTDFFCVHTPKSGACGNAVCESGENTCSCSRDCGVCARETRYLQYACESNTCKGTLKSGITAVQESLFDPRQLGAFELTITYKYQNPFNTKTDTIALDTTLKTLSSGVSNPTITSVRFLDGSRVVGELLAPQKFGGVGSKIMIKVPVTSMDADDVEKVLSLRVEYSFVRSDKTETGQFTRSLNKATFVTPS